MASIFVLLNTKIGVIIVMKYIKVRLIMWFNF